MPHLAQKKRELESVGSVGNCQIEREDHTLQFLSSSSQGVWNVGHSPSGIEESRLYCMANKDTYILGGVVMSLFGVGRGSQFSQGGGLHRNKLFISGADGIHLHFMAKQNELQQLLKSTNKRCC